MMIDTFEFSFSTRSLSLSLDSLWGLDCDFNRVWECRRRRRGEVIEARVGSILIALTTTLNNPLAFSCSSTCTQGTSSFFSAFCRLSPLMPLYRICLSSPSPPPLSFSHDPHVVLSFFQHAWKSRNEKCFVCNFSFHLFLSFFVAVAVAVVVCVLNSNKTYWTRVAFEQHEQLMQHMFVWNQT